MALTCHQCGKPILEGAPFCAWCGAPVPESSEISTSSASTADFRPIDVRPSEVDLMSAGERYLIGDLIGKGGWGEVRVAHDRLLHRDVALKVLHTHMSVSSVDRERFLEEAKVAAQLTHPGIVPIYDMGKLENGQIYLTMKLLGRRTLKHVMDDRVAGRADVPLKRLLTILLDVCQALAYAHQKKVIHRDIAPKNVMVGDLGEVSVVDWGLAKVLTGRKFKPEERVIETMDGSMMGTVAYMAPEQLIGAKDVDERADVYAIGVILFEMLSGRIPIQGATHEELIRKRFTEPTPKLRDVVPQADIPPSLERITLRAMAEEKKDRYPSAKDLAEDLQDYLDGVTEAERRQKEASLRLAEGKALLTKYHQLRDICSAHEESYYRLEGRMAIPPYGSLEERLPLFRAHEEVGRLRGEREEAFNQVVLSLAAALTYDPTNPSVRAAFADLYVERLLAAEADGRHEDATFFKGQASHYDDGSRATILKGDGTLTLSTDPDGASVKLFRYVERNRMLHEEDERDLGSTPVAVSLAMGSYVVVITKAGYAPVRYPVLVTRGRAVKAHVLLLTDDEAGGPTFSYVPRMDTFLPRDPRVGFPSRTVSTPGFCIGKHHVTMGAYAEWLNALVRSGKAEDAQARAPREGAVSGHFWRPGDDGFFHLPITDVHGHVHEPEYPVVWITWHDAKEYCRWRSEGDERIYRLPTDDEWELVARGADGRSYPWGNSFEPHYANTNSPHPLAVSTFPTDRSPFEVFGLAGNAFDWCDNSLSTVSGSQDQLMHCRGGAYPSGSVPAANILLKHPLSVGPIGMRLVHVPGRLRS